jgi:molecular chaperone HtpG
VIVDSDALMTTTMRRILRAAAREGAVPSPERYDLEINPRHAILVRLAQERQADPALAAKVAEQLLDNARVAAGLLEDPRAMLQRLNELLERVLGGAPAGRA